MLLEVYFEDEGADEEVLSHTLEVRHRDHDLLHFIGASRGALVAHVRRVVGLTPWARHPVMDQLVPHVVDHA